MHQEIRVSEPWSSCKRPFRPIGEGRQTQCVIPEALGEQPKWSSSKSFSWGSRVAFRWVHFMGAGEKTKQSDSRHILAILQGAGLATEKKFLTRLSRESLDRLDIWSQVWWLTPNLAAKIVEGANISHAHHDAARRRPIDVIRSAIYD